MLTKSEQQYYQQYPLSHPAYNVIRIAGRRIKESAIKYFSGKLLEIGCGTKAKSLLIREYVTEHIGLDHEECPHGKTKIDIIGSAYQIPEKNDSFNCILSTAVLEHLEEPQKALTEAFRVLKPGGYAIYTAPLFWHIHEAPRDFFRYTSYGLKHLFKNAGFEIIEIKAMSGFWNTFITEFNYYLQRFKKGIFSPLVDLIVALNNLTFAKLDIGKLRDENFTWMYIVVVRKPDKHHE